MTHQDFREMLPAHALDALDPEEARQLEAHLVTCAECQAELRVLRDVAASLGTAVPAVAPLAALRQQILEAVRPRPPARVAWDWRSAAALAAVIVALLIADLTYLSIRLGRLQVDLAAQQQALVLLSSPSAKTAALAGSVPGHVRLVYDPKQRRGALVVSDLGNPGADLVYQVWLIAGEQPVSAAVFRPAPGGPVIIPISADFPQFRLVAISVEPAPNGSPQPTRTPVLSGPL